ncbi:hypothetical protein O181_015840 [Austropuccinia psidii MF-1]|uniref:Integrase zinc-binding domain-containing protein n=1 Tax=Austropuccinia psidii MF-1 TaxID=1389203 RepID=A0A9Q3GRC0_9BASI|nr:hypothetical protein [Austropuccinia psidii MF-1]
MQYGYIRVHQGAIWHQKFTIPLPKDDGHNISRRNSKSLDGSIYLLHDYILRDMGRPCAVHRRSTKQEKNFRFSEWEPESDTLDSEDTESEGTETPILGISPSDLQNEFFSAVMNTYAKHKQCGILLQIFPQKYRIPEIESQLKKSWLRNYKDNNFYIIDGLIYHREKHTSALTVIDRENISWILWECHDCPYMGHMSEDRTKERVASTAWSPKWEEELSEYINTCERFQKGNRKNGKKYGYFNT